MQIAYTYSFILFFYNFSFLLFLFVLFNWMPEIMCVWRWLFSDTILLLRRVAHSSLARWAFVSINLFFSFLGSVLLLLLLLVVLCFFQSENKCTRFSKRTTVVRHWIENKNPYFSYFHHLLKFFSNIRTFTTRTIMTAISFCIPLIE